VRTTEVFELKTAEDVDRFCDLIKRLKSLAPRSLRYTVAVTADRSVTFTEGPRGERGGRRAIHSALRKAGRRGA
jgi:hypothetical protein